MAKRMTMADLATRAGVSASTVSRVLNGKSVVARETARRIRQLASDMGYTMRRSRRSPSAPKGGERRVLIVSKQALGGGGGLAALSGALLVELSGLGFSPRLIHEQDVGEDRLENVCGAIFVHGPDETLSALFQGIACVQVLGTPGLGAALDTVTYDCRMVGMLAADWLYRRGCRRLLAILPTNPIATTRGNAFLERAAELACSAVVIQTDGYAIGDEQADEAVQQLLACTPRPDGLFAFNDLALLCLYPRLLKAGIDLDNSLKLIGCDAESFLSALLPRPATIDVHMAQIAKRASETLAWRLLNPHDRPASVMLRPEIVEPDELVLRLDSHVAACLP